MIGRSDSCRSFVPFATIGTLALLLAGCAQSQAPTVEGLAQSGPPATFEQPARGTEFTYRVGNAGNTTFEVAARGSDAYTLRSPKMSARVHSGIFPIWDSHGLALQEDNVASLWPMEVGDEAFVVVKYKRSDLLAKWSVRVVGYTQTQVPAGTFDTYVLRQEVRNNKGTYSGTALYWYAPKLDIFVKREYELHRGQRSWPHFELVDYQRPEAA